jgi:diaminohydroxyphosphoribosylaminopyrimidine deaminase / 5-amino-6-(5-phosphoribosylamino)uracil reductase
VITGIGTVLADDPMLNVRLAKAFKQPLRVVLDPFLDIPLHSQMVHTAHEFPLLVIKSQGYINPEKEETLKELGVLMEYAPPILEGLDLHSVLRTLYSMQKMQVMIEAGPKLSSSFLRHGLIDKLYYFISPKVIGGKHMLFEDVGVEQLGEAHQFKVDELKTVGTDILMICYPIKEHD